MNKKIIMIVAAVLVLGGGGAAWYFLMGPGAAVEAAEAVPPPPPPPGLLEMEEFLANLNDPGGDHYAKLKVTLAITPPESIPTITEDPLVMARLRDRILTLLTGKTFEDLTSPEGKEKFRQEILDGISEIMTGAELKEVLFSDFIVQ